MDVRRAMVTGLKILVALLLPIFRTVDKSRIARNLGELGACRLILLVLIRWGGQFAPPGRFFSGWPAWNSSILN